MATALDYSAEDLDNPLAPHVIRRKLIQQDAIRQLTKNRNAIAQANQQAQQAQDQTKGPIALGDAYRWMLAKNLQGSQAPNPYHGATFGQAPEEAQEHFLDAYGPVMGPEAWKEAQSNLGGGISPSLQARAATLGMAPEQGETPEALETRIAQMEQGRQTTKTQEQVDRDARADQTMTLREKTAALSEERLKDAEQRQKDALARQAERDKASQETWLNNLKKSAAQLGVSGADKMDEGQLLDAMGKHLPAQVVESVGKLMAQKGELQAALADATDDAKKAELRDKLLQVLGALDQWRMQLAPPGQQPAPAGQPKTQPAPAAQTPANQLPVAKDKSAYDTLEPGTVYIGPDGKQYTKRSDGQ